MTEQQKQAALLRDALVVLDQVEQYLDSRTATQGSPIRTRETRLLHDVTQILNRGYGWGKGPDTRVCETAAIPALQPITTAVRQLSAPEFTRGKP